MDPLRLFEAARDPYPRRQTPSQQSLSLATSLSSGQPYYTVESLEGATSLPVLKTVAPASLPRRENTAPSVPLPSERDALLRLEAQTRALISERETLDVRARLLAAEREALILRNLPGGATSLTDRRISADGLQPFDARTRVNADGLHPLDVRVRVSLEGLQQNLDARARVLSNGLDVRPHDTLQTGLENRMRVLPHAGGLALGAASHAPLSELLRFREHAAGARRGAPPYLAAADPLLLRRDITDLRTDIRAQSGPPSFHPEDTSLSRKDAGNHRAEIPDVRGGLNDRPFTNGTREPPAAHSEPAETRKQADRNKGPSSSKPPSAAAGKIKPPPEQSEGWCAVCKKDCANLKTLGIHVVGKKHKATVERLLLKVDAASTGALVKEVSPYVPAVTIQADKKRASDTPEALQTMKRVKVSSASAVACSAPPSAPVTAVASTVPLSSGMVTTDFKKASKQVKPPAAKIVVTNPSHLVCEVCNIFTTGQKNLEIHLKGKRHVARVKELANS